MHVQPAEETTGGVIVLKEEERLEEARQDMVRAKAREKDCIPLKRQVQEKTRGDHRDWTHGVIGSRETESNRLACCQIVRKEEKKEKQEKEQKNKEKADRGMDLLLEDRRQTAPVVMNANLDYVLQRRQEVDRKVRQ